ncbi:divergent PAP2 family protein [Candidatus Falkowbacteria bacterium]|nr:divergent PAP2 family protein [Candidatus Falkowbacteria bacterium]
MYLIILLPLISGFIAQGLKLLIKSNRKTKLKNFLVTYSGMPSGHSASVVSLAVISGLREGFESSAFAISLILAIIVIRDALGIRRYLGEHGKTLNILVHDLKDDDVLEKRYPHLLEEIGHTPAQVAVGSSIGLAVSLIGHFMF